MLGSMIKLLIKAIAMLIKKIDIDTRLRPIRIALSVIRIRVAILVMIGRMLVEPIVPTVSKITNRIKRYIA